MRRTRTHELILGLVLVLGSAPAALAQSPQTPGPNQPAAGDAEAHKQVLDFVRKVHIPHVSYKEVSKLDPRVAIPVLVNLLDDAQEVESWPNSVVTLGMLGNAAAAQPMIQFLNKGQAGQVLSRDGYIAKSSALMALGYIVHKGKDQTTLNYLIKSTDPKIWSERKLPWRSPFYKTEAELHGQLSTMAILGLGLSGSATARGHLETLAKGKTPEARRLLAVPGAREAIAEAIKANEYIEKHGLERYYAQTDPSATP